MNQENAFTIELHGFTRNEGIQTQGKLLEILSKYIDSKKSEEFNGITISLVSSEIVGLSGKNRIIRFFGTKYSKHFVTDALKEIGWKEKFEFIKI